MSDLLISLLGLVGATVLLDWIIKLLNGGCTCGIYAYDDDENSPKRVCPVHADSNAGGA